jgi:hypothetical protein
VRSSVEAAASLSVVPEAWSRRVDTPECSVKDKPPAVVRTLDAPAPGTASVEHIVRGQGHANTEED